MKSKLSKKSLLIHGLIQLMLVLLIIPLTYNFFPIQKGSSHFYLSESTHDALIDTLEIHGYSVSFFDKIMLFPFDPPKKGWYEITEIPTKRWNFFRTLPSFNSKTIRIKIYAGENTQELTKRLANDLKLDQEKLLEAYRNKSIYLEGDLLSGFYPLPSKANEESVMNALFSISHAKLKVFTQRHCDSIPNELEFKILLIIASIIQKESNDPQEMPLISSVIENRLEKGMKLQMDSTLNYGKYSHKIITSKRINKDKTYYNTYKYKGIPPTPLCTVSLEALKSALYPSSTNYLYFMLNKNGKHNFSASYTKHKKNIKAFRQKSTPKNKHISKDSNESKTN